MSDSIGWIGEKIDILIRQGADFGPVTETILNPDGSPVDLTGCAFRGQIRKTSDDPVVAEFVFEIDPNPTSGVSRWSLPRTATLGIECGSSLRDPKSQYVYDHELVDASGRVLPLRYGVVFVQREVTR